MKLRFAIHYVAAWGQSLRVQIVFRRRDGKRHIVNVPLTTSDGDLWSAETSQRNSPRSPYIDFSYRYQVIDNGYTVIRNEWNLHPRRYAFHDDKTYVFDDIWRDKPLQYYLLTQAYATWHGQKDTFEGQQSAQALTDKQMPLFRKTLFFRVLAPQLKAGESLALLGNHPILGDWNPQRYLLMHKMGLCEWMLTVNVNNVAQSLEYKYVVIKDEDHSLVRWEQGDNRIATCQNLVDSEVLVQHGDVTRLSDEQWHGAGVSVNVLSLRSEKSCGVGDLGSLLQLLQWSSQVGMAVLQTTTLQDVYKNHVLQQANPFAVVSAYALNPLLIDLDALGPLSDETKMNTFLRQRRELNALSVIDFDAVTRVKEAYVRERFAEEGEACLASEAFKAFYAQHASWLRVYAMYKALCLHGTPEELMTDTDKAYSTQLIDRLSADDSSLAADVHWIYYLQYHLYDQLRMVSEYARKHRIALMMTLPYGYSQCSVEVWEHPQFFDKRFVIGELPSYDNPQGVKSSLPLLVRPLQPASQAAFDEWRRQPLVHWATYVDAILLDYIDHYFTTWAIPQEATQSMMGVYRPSLPLREEELQCGIIDFNKKLYRQPFINDAIIQQLFGIHSAYAKQHYLTAHAYGLYTLRGEVSDQQAIDACFKGKNDENSQWIKNGLEQLCANRLFVSDPDNPQWVHPRLAGNHTLFFHMLNNEEQQAYLGLSHSYFHRRYEAYWKQNGTQTLDNLLADSNLLVVVDNPTAELSPAMTEVVNRQRLMPLCMQLRQRGYDGAFGHLEQNSYQTMDVLTTPSTLTLHQWWESNPYRTQHFALTKLQKEGRISRRLSPMLAEELVRRHLFSPSMLCVLSLTDWLAMDSQLSYEGHSASSALSTVDDEREIWAVRAATSLETLAQAQPFNRKLASLLVMSRRAMTSRD